MAKGSDRARQRQSARSKRDKQREKQTRDYRTRDEQQRDAARAAADRALEATQRARRTAAGIVYPESWQEQAERHEATDRLSAFMRLPPAATFEAESTIVRRNMASTTEGQATFASLYVPGAHARVLGGEPFGTRTGGNGVGIRHAPPPESFTWRNVQHFQFLPSVEAIKQAVIEKALLEASAHISPALMLAGMAIGGHHTPRSILSAEQDRVVRATVRAEQAHLLYHKAMWRANGRHVVVLDPTTYGLLANTDLPQLPASLLAAPWPAFYIQLPPRMFEFECADVRTGAVDRRFAEGISVAIDRAEPVQAGDTVYRELAFIVMGEEEGNGPEGRNCAFASIRFGSAAQLAEFDMNAGAIQNAGNALNGVAYASTHYLGAYELAVVVPRVILGLMLYLASDHPDVVPIPPTARRTFSDIRSEPQRRAALDRQARELRGATRLPVIVVGSHMRDEVETEARAAQARDAAAGKKWTLDHAVYVRGHWRNQAHGEGRQLRTLRWIRPFLRGPDAAESLKIRAARVPFAIANPNPAPPAGVRIV